jgi:uncharacterized protein
MTTYLLDVSTVIALLDRTHVSHGTVHQWFDATGKAGWATCPIVENGVVRILSQPSYPNSMNSPALAATYVRKLCETGSHQFWSDDISLVRSPLIDPAFVLSAAQVTDTYLLALAVHRQGTFATLDRRLSSAAIKDGKDHLLLLH